MSARAAGAKWPGILFAAAIATTLPILWLNVWPVLSAQVESRHA
jgi:hypothetical protein